MLLKNELEKLEQMIAFANRKNDKISVQGIDWHLDHALKVIISIDKAMHKSKPERFKWKFSLARAYVYTFNYIPRGRGKSPKSVVAQGEITKQDLKNQLEHARECMSKYDQFDRNSYFYHQYFGKLNKRMAAKFLKLHTRHHLKIMKDILK